MTAHSYVAWFRPSAANPVNTPLVGMYKPSAVRTSFFYASGTIPHFPMMDIEGIVYSATQAAVTQNQWVMLSLTYDGGNSNC